MTKTIPYYLDFLPATLLESLQHSGEPNAAIPGLVATPGLRERFPDIETDEALAFVCDLYRDVRDQLHSVLEKRAVDRAFIDAATASCAERNADKDYLSSDYETVIGMQNSEGETVVGPLPEELEPLQVSIPSAFVGPQVTLFGPPDTAKMSINAMNALHRKRPDEPSIVAELVDASGTVPRWGADVEDSKTPIIGDLLSACANLQGCYQNTLSFDDPARGKSYRLAPDRRSLPIKRIPGLALPDGNHLLDGAALPLHIYDLGLHLFHNRTCAEALILYVPKIETEYEAEYFKALLSCAEARLQQLEPDYVLGSVKLFIVFENPRAIFRIREIAKALSPHFIGGSLGWHDFLASTARLFKNDANYQIPVKADPNIVINHIRESHLILVEALKPLGALTIGGMYGVLYEEGNPESFEVCMVGYIKDVVTQLRRGLDGFWVAHPDFVRVGIALVEAWKRHDNGDSSPLYALVRALISNPEPLLAFIEKPDVPGLTRADHLYARGVLAATLQTSDVIANHDPEEVRYNVFQAVQYLTDWLCGNGCVALPATLANTSGEKVFVRVMDDLATTERSRWELWAEVHHGRVSVAMFDRILEEELEFIRSGSSAATKRVQVAWSGDAALWYPIAAKLLRQLVLASEPVEFVTQLLMPFTLACVREASDPWGQANRLCPGKYKEA